LLLWLIETDVFQIPQLHKHFNVRYAQCYQTVRIYLTILTILLFLTSCDMKSAKEYLVDAEGLEMQREYMEAIQLLDKAISKDQNFLGAYINRGADKSALGDFKGAIEDYMKVVTLDPKNTLALFNIGNNYKRLDDHQSAVIYYNKAFATKGGEGIYVDFTPNPFVDLDKFDVPGHEISYERAIAFYQLDSLNRAFSDFQHSISKDFMTADCYQRIGYIYVSRGQKEKACEYFQKAIDLGNKDAESDKAKYCND
jgi:tetratricopeptide (TPR) repeat protein